MICTLLFSGCGERRPDGMPPLYPTKLTFIQAGKPLPGVRVTLFFEDENQKNWPISGISDSNGVAVLKTQAIYNGVPAGRYVVCVEKNELNYTQPVTPAEAEVLKERFKTNPPMVTEFIPPQFAKRSESPLKLEVAPKGSTKQEFDLGEAYKLEKPESI